MFVVRFRVGVPVKDDPGKGHPFFIALTIGVTRPSLLRTIRGSGVSAAPAQSLDEPLWVPPLGVRFNIFLKSLDKMLEIVFNEREVSNG